MDGVSSLKDGTHPAQSVLKQAVESEPGRRLEGNALRGLALVADVFPDEGLEQVHDLLLLAAGKMGCGLKHLLHAAFGG